MLGQHGRVVTVPLLTPLARMLVRWGVHPNVITVFGTVAASLAAVLLLANGFFILGPLVVGGLLLIDSVDGLMAREGEGETDFGAFLDSTLDRVTDAAVFLSLLIYFLRFAEGNNQSVGIFSAATCLALGAIVPYARSKAEALGYTASVGIAERADRLLVALLAALVVGFGAPEWVLIAVLIALSIAAAITIIQRIATVYAQERDA